MAIRDEIILDPSKGIKGLDEMNRATMKYARKQDRLFKQNKQSIQAIEDELQKLRRVREASNNPEAVRKYTNTIEKLEKEQKQLRKETEKYESAVKKTSKTSESAFKKIGRSAKLWLAGAAAGALLYIGSLVRDMGGEMMRFNEEMNKSLAIQGDVTMEQRNRMEKAAKEVSRELNIATDKVAQGYFYLASAGLSAEQQIANLPQVAEFAKAGMFDLATATDLATDAQSALGLTVDNTADNQRNLIRVTDVLTKANTVSNATIQQFSEALTNKAGTRLRQFNKDVEEGAAVLAAYADQGIKGRLAGERLNILYRELARTWRENTEAFEEFGIQVFDQNGEMRNTADILEELEEAFGDMSSEQRDAALAMLGFTSESQDSINAIIGMSEEVRGYEEDLRSAAGTTEEVAGEQLKSLTERLGLLKRQLIDTFGDDVVSAIEATVRGLETLYRLVRGTEQELQKESIIQGALDRSGVSRPDISGPYSDSFRDELEKLYDQQRKNTEGFNRQNRELTETISSYATWASGVEEASEKVADANEELLFREMVLKKNIDRNEELIDSEETSVKQKAKLIVKNEALNRKLESVQENISKTREYLNQTTEEEKKQQEQVDELASSYDYALRKFGEFQDYLNNITSLGRQQAGGAGLGELPTVIADINEQMDKLAKGEITQEDFFESLPDDLKDAADAGEETQEIFEDIADTADALINVADAFGQIGDNARKSLNGIADVLRNVQKLKNLQGAGNLTAMSGALPAIGIAGGVMSMISGIVGQNKEEERRNQQLVSQLGSLERELRRNTQALREQAVIGSDISQAQLSDAGSMISRLNDLIGEAENVEDIFDLGGREALEAKDLLDELSNLGIEALEGFSPALFDSIWARMGGQMSDVPDVLREILGGSDEYEGLNQIIQELTGNLGQFGESLEGAIERFDITTQLGMDPAEAFDTFIQDVIGLVGEDNQITKLLEQIAEAESPEGRKELANQLWEAFQDNPALLGSDLTGSDLQEIIDMILGQEGVAGSESEGYSRSVQIARTITDVQANEMIMFLERIEAWTRATAASLGDQTAMSIAVPDVAYQPTSGGSIANINQSMSKSNNLSIGDINMSSGITDEDIDTLMLQISRRLKQELRGSQF